MKRLRGGQPSSHALLYRLRRIDKPSTADPIAVSATTVTILGRSAVDNDAHVSRKSVRVLGKPDGVLLENVGRSLVQVQESPAATPYRIKTVSPGTSMMIHPGDRISLLPDVFSFELERWKPNAPDEARIMRDRSTSALSSALTSSADQFSEQFIICMPDARQASALQIGIWKKRVEKAGGVLVDTPPWPRHAQTAASSLAEELEYQRQSAEIIKEYTQGRAVVILLGADVPTEKLRTWLALPTLPFASNVRLLSQKYLREETSSATVIADFHGTTQVDYHTYKWLLHRLSGAVSPSESAWRPWQSPWCWLQGPDSDEDSTSSIRYEEAQDDKKETASTHLELQTGNESNTAGLDAGPQKGDEEIPVPAAGHDTRHYLVEDIGTGKLTDPMAIHPISKTVPSTFPTISADELRVLWSWGDEASRWGLKPGETLMPCPFSRETILHANGSLIKLNPWLDVIIGADEKSVAADKNAFSQAHGENLNEHITKWLKMLHDVYSAYGGPENDARIKQLDHAIGYLMHAPIRVTDPSQLQGVPGIGPSTLQKVTEILKTGLLERAHTLYNDERTKALIEFNSLIWVGPVTARRWYEMGFRSLEDVRQRGQHLLSYQQKIGLKYYDEINMRIPRSESGTLFRIVKQQVESILPGSLCVLGGSYRRGQPTSSDFDFILAPPAPHGTCALLIPLYKRLKEMGILTDDLLASWMSVESDGRDTSSNLPPSPANCHTYFGMCLVPGIAGAIHRRIDLKCFTQGEAPYALISWTGNTPLNRTIRQYATNLGYELDERSMIPTIIKKADPKRSRNQEVHALDVGCRCEYDVFSFLGLRFIPPNQRNPYSHHFDLNKQQP